MVPVKTIGWWHRDTNEHRSEHEGITRMEFVSGKWVSVKLWQVKIESGTVIMHPSHMDIALTDLWSDFGTRYREALDGVVEASEKGILSYSPRAFFPTERNRLEAMRARTKKYFRVVEYEHNLLFNDDEIGESLMGELWEHEEAAAKEKRLEKKAEGVDWNTIYIKGFAGTKAKEKGNLVKVYRDDDLGGMVKVEVTLRNAYIKRNQMGDVGSAWETQPEIQSRIHKALQREWKALLEKAPDTGRMLMERMPKVDYKLHGREREGRIDLLNFMVSTTNTFTEHRKRIEAVEQAQAELAARVARLEGGKGEKPI